MRDFQFAFVMFCILLRLISKLEVITSYDYLNKIQLIRREFLVLELEEFLALQKQIYVILCIIYRQTINLELYNTNYVDVLRNLLAFHIFYQANAG